jgi:transcriptional regulator with XRE-family HTH domain
LQEARANAGLSQKGLGVLAGLDPSVASPRINQYERGKHVPTFTTLTVLGRVLGVPVTYFYCDDDNLAALLLAYAAATDRDRKKALRALQG